MKDQLKIHTVEFDGLSLTLATKVNKLYKFPTHLGFYFVSGNLSFRAIQFLS